MGACSGIQPDQYSEPDFLKFIAGETDGQPHLRITTCIDAAGVTCEPPSPRLFTEDLENGARHEQYMISESPTACRFIVEILEAYESSIGLTVDYRMYDGYVSDVACTPEEAERHLASLRCVYRDEMLGERS